jgi:hypothetical protein
MKLLPGKHSIPVEIQLIEEFVVGHFCTISERCFGFKSKSVSRKDKGSTKKVVQILCLSLGRCGFA